MDKESSVVMRCDSNGWFVEVTTRINLTSGTGRKRKMKDFTKSIGGEIDRRCKQAIMDVLFGEEEK